MSPARGTHSQLGLFGSPSPTGPGSPLPGSTLPQDHAARSLAQTEFRRPLLLAAGAGTGKTTTLTARVLAWVLGAGWEAAAARLAKTGAEPLDDERVAAAVLGGVVAITFTEAAAAEMARRTGEGLAGLARGEAPPWLLAAAVPEEPTCRARAQALLATLDHLTVATIHAFCRGLLAAHPLAAGLHADFTVDATGAAVEELARELVEGQLATVYGDPGDPAWLALAQEGIGPEDLVAALVAFAQEAWPVAALEHDPLTPERLTALTTTYGAAARRLLELAGPPLRGLARQAKAQEVLAALDGALERLRDPAPPSAEVLAAEVAGTWETPHERLREWARGRFNTGEAAALGGGAREVQAAARELLLAVDTWRELQPARLDTARRVLLPLYRELRRQLVARGITTFQDLLRGARDLLVEHPAVAARVRGRIDQLLVDEFQDTDQVQCDLLRALALSGPPETRPGLFLVGDPKQSIYGWRSADLAAYDRFRAELTAAGGREADLAVSFRSVPALLEQVRETLAPLMVEERGLQPPFVPLVPSAERAGSPGFITPPWAPVELWATQVPGETKGLAEEATRREAAAIAADVARLHREAGVAWRQVALLLRSGGDLDDYLEAFRRAGVPFAVTGDRQYYRRREVIDAAALVRAVIDPGDHLALVTLLRSPVVGLPDAALLPLWRRAFPQKLTELAGPDPAALAELGGVIDDAAREVAESAAEVPGLAELTGWPVSLRAAVTALGELRASLQQDAADHFLERLRGLFPSEPLAAARYLGAYRLANLERFFRRLGEALEEAEGDLGATLRALRRGVSEALEEEEGRPATGDDDAVQVMTIHRAKGLDFDHVYLGQLHKQKGREPESALRLGPSGDALGRGAEYKLLGAATPGFAAVRAERERVEARERVRTLYVAMTRARDRLVLCGDWTRSSPRGVDEAQSALDLIHGARFPTTPDWHELQTRAEREASPRVHHGGVQWYFPALDTSSGAAPEKVPEKVPADSAAPTAGGFRAVSPADRAAARARSARPLGGAVSADAHHRLAELQAAEDSAPAPPSPEGSRDTALAVGTAVHRALEELVPGDDPSAALAGVRSRLADFLRPLELSAAVAAAAEAEADAVLAALAGGRLLARWAELEIVARELPLLLPAPPGPADGAAPVAYLAGAIDLLARDRTRDELLVIDFKTDHTADEAALAARAEAYRPQLQRYAQAVAAALGLAAPVRAELWFLRADRVVTLD